MRLSSVFQRVKPMLQKAVRPFVRKGPMHWIRFAALLALASYLGHVLGESNRYTDLRYAIYQDQLKLQRRGQAYPQHTVLVLLDDDDYWGNEFEGRRPLKRDQLAALIDRLDQAGVNTVAVDIDLRSSRPDAPSFDYPGYRAEDQVLLGALRRMCDHGGHVVLASSIRYASDGNYEVMPSIYTVARSEFPCVTSGYIQLPDDMRLVPGELKLKGGATLDSFSLAIVRIDDPIAYDHAVHNEQHGFRFSQFLTPADFRPKEGRQFIFDGQQIEHMSDVALRRAVADKTVILGGDWHEYAYGTGPSVDMWLSPGGVEPGAMLHGNYVEAMLNGTGTFTPISDATAEVLEWTLAFGLATIAALEIHSSWKWTAFVLCSGFSVLLTYVLLQNLGLFLDFMIPLLMIVVHTVADEVLEMRHQVQHLKHQLHEHH
jgi:hypothetical protein